MAAPFALAPAVSAASISAVKPRRLASRSASSASPTTEQSSAISTLLPYNECSIIAWLTLIRCVEPGLKCRAGAGPLTLQQLDALSLLSPSCDKDVKSWLDLGRRQSGSVYSQRFSQCSTLVDSRLSRGSSAAADTFASLALDSTPEDPLEFSDLDQKCMVQTSSAMNNGEKNLDLDKELPPSPRLKPEHCHFVTSRKHDRPIMTCDGFKRQEMEQTRRWVFMPLGPIENSSQGTCCALCPAREPDIEHLRFHGTEEYASRPEPVKKTRKGEFVKVLRKHKVHEQWIQGLVEKWCVYPPKKAYSCGFCIRLFRTFSERNRHLCDAHFHRGEDMTKWHVTNLIRGLLLQEHINRAYREMFGLDPSNADWHRAWRLSSLEDLQHRLEEDKESPYELALAAHAAMRHTETSQGSHKTSETGSQFAAKYQHMPKTSATLAHNIIPSFSTSIPTNLASQPSTRMPLEVMSVGYDQHLEIFDSGLDLSKVQDAPIDLVSAVNPPVRVDSLDPGFDPDATVPARLTGGSSDFQWTYAGPINANAQTRYSPNTVNVNDDVGSELPLPCALCLYSHSPRVYCDSDQRPALDLVMDSYSLPDYTEPDDTASPRFLAVKRKLSDESASVANRTAQTPSPNESFVQR